MQRYELRHAWPWQRRLNYFCQVCNCPSLEQIREFSNWPIYMKVVVQGLPNKFSNEKNLQAFSDLDIRNWRLKAAHCCIPMEIDETIFQNPLHQWKTQLLCHLDIEEWTLSTGCAINLADYLWHERNWIEINVTLISVTILLPSWYRYHDGNILMSSLHLTVRLHIDWKDSSWCIPQVAMFCSCCLLSKVKPCCQKKTAEGIVLK